MNPDYAGHSKYERFTQSYKSLTLAICVRAIDDAKGIDLPNRNRHAIQYDYDVL